MTTTSLSTLVRRAVVAGVPVVADTSAAFVSENAQVMLQLLQELAVFAPSREETQLLLPDYDDDAAALRLARQGVHLLLKCGPDGAIVVSARGESVQRIPAPPAAVVDPTGAGDATVGALAAHWAAGSDFLAAASASLLTGALATTGLGPVALGLVQTEPAQSMNLMG
jgi:sugar/nucleoside kinase (ribokinase family)